MPKAIIREYDNSTSSTPAELNFAVVVPGICASEEQENKIFELNEDGIYICKSQKDFDKMVGLTVATDIDAEAPTLEVLSTDETTELPVTYDNLLLSQVMGYAIAGYGIYTRADKTGTPGYLSDGTHVYTKVADVNQIDYDTNSKTVTKYSVIKCGNEGSYKVTGGGMGNQIAYELIGLGYTILYKCIPMYAEQKKLDAKSLVDLLSVPTFWEPLKDKSKYDFRYITSGGFTNIAILNQISQVATFKNSVKLEAAEIYGADNGRGDCIALVDVNEDTIVKTSGTGKLIASMTDWINRLTCIDTYSAIFAPKVTYNLDSSRTEKFNGNATFPASFHFLACAAQARQRYAEWYAVAGYTRGVSAFDVVSTSINFGEITINTLAPRTPLTINVDGYDYTVKHAVNLILNERGNYYIWGNRTAKTLDTDGLIFSHFLNIRELCASIKKQVYTACRTYTFEPNSDLLWLNFVNAIKPLLTKMQNDQGIAGYEITRVEDTRKALLTANIRIVPIEAVEDFDISIYLEDSLAGVNATAAETEA